MEHETIVAIYDTAAHAQAAVERVTETSRTTPVDRKI